MSDHGAIGAQIGDIRRATSTPPANYGITRLMNPATQHFTAYSGPYLTVSGTVQQAGSPAARVVRAYRRFDGKLLGEATSDPTTGAFEIDCLGCAGPVYVLAIDDLTNAPDYNAEIFDLITPA